MPHEPDVFVCKPGAMINDPKTAVFIQFEKMDPETRKGIGTNHQIAMTTADAMSLLGVLQAIQKMFDLPVPAEPPEHTRIPKKKEQN